MAIDLEAWRAECLVDCIDENGNAIKIHIEDHTKDDFVLIVDGSKRYHTCAGCFEYWDDRLREKFKGWKKISLDEAIRRGLTKCALCDHILGDDEDDE